IQDPFHILSAPFRGRSPVHIPKLETNMLRRSQFVKCLREQLARGVGGCLAIIKFEEIHRAEECRAFYGELKNATEIVAAIRSESTEDSIIGCDRLGRILLLLPSATARESQQRLE